MVVCGSDETYAGDKDYPRVGVEHRRVALGVSLPFARVVLLVLLSVCLYALAQLRLQLVCALLLRIEVHPQGFDLRPYQVVRAGSSYLGELLRVPAADELEDIFGGVIGAQDLVGCLIRPRRECTAKSRQDLCEQHLSTL